MKLSKDLLTEYFPDVRIFIIDIYKKEAEKSSKMEEKIKMPERHTVKNQMSTNFHKKTNLRRYRLLVY